MDIPKFNRDIAALIEIQEKAHPGSDPRDLMKALVHNAALVADHYECGRDDFVRICIGVWDVMKHEGQGRIILA